MSRARMLAKKSLPPLLWLTALALLSWTLSQMPVAELWQRVKALSSWQWLLWLLTNVLLIVVSTWRWQVLCKLSDEQPGFWRLLSIRQAGQCISFITPGPQFGGEPFQIWWLMQRGRMSLHKALLCLGLDRFYELWINFLMLVLGILFLLFSSELLTETGDGLLPVLGVLLILLLVSAVAIVWLAQNPAWLRQRIEHIGARWLKSPKLNALTETDDALTDEVLSEKVLSDKVAQPTAAAQSTSKMPAKAPASRTTMLLGALILSLAAWLVIALEMWLVLGFFSLSPDLLSVILVLVAMRLALLLPLPGGIGTLEASVFWSFQLLGWPVGAALAVIALMRLRDVLVLLAGMACVVENRRAEQGAA